MDRELSSDLTPEQEPKVLNFEEFSQREGEQDCPGYNNLFLYFIAGPTGEVYRKSEYYQKLQSEHPDIVEALSNNIQSDFASKGTSAPLRPFDKDLYEVYKIMRSYGASDRDLFA